MHIIFARIIHMEHKIKYVFQLISGPEYRKKMLCCIKVATDSPQGMNLMNSAY